jgi:uncharacterized membrane protein
MQVALALSVTLNLIVAGFVGGAMLRGPHGPEGKDREFSFGPFSDAMEPAERKALRKDILQRAPGLGQMRQEMRADMDKVVAALRAEPFDPAALTNVMEAQQARLTGQISVGSQALRDFLLTMDAPHRHAFADRLEDRLKRKDKH